MSVLVVLAVLAVVLIGLWVYSTAHRLDRLHVRTDAAWIALDSALGRRAAVVRAAVAAGVADAHLATLADRAERAPRSERGDAENELSGALSSARRHARADSAPARESPQLAAELADAEARVQLARRFHNDAVRDTLALRSRRPVQLLRLGGTAAQPAYFELVEPLATAVAAVVVPRPRPSTRVLLLDADARVLLMRGQDGDGPAWWFATGGGVEAGESPAAAGVREVAEETGLSLTEDALCGPLWTRSAVLTFDGELIEARETFFTARVASFEPSPAGFTEVERATLTTYRWCSPTDVRVLEAEGERVYPPGLDALLAEAVAALDAPPPLPSPRAIP
ncbi:MAG: NUDIX domain-containing protein [Mycobacteriaceae bacterium]